MAPGNQKPAPVIEVAAALIEQDGRYLIARRRDDAALGGFWEFPGGKRKSGESLEACLQREVREEVGVEVAIVSPCDRGVHAYPHATIDISFYRCALIAGEPRALGCAELRWVAPHELAGFRFPPANTALIQRLIAESPCRRG
jgi:mutator protein MutT